MKKTLIFTIFALLLFGCGSNNKEIIQPNEKEYYNAYENIDKNKMETVISYAELNINITDPLLLYEDAPMIAIIQVECIDRGSNYNVGTGEYTYPFTVGKMTIKQVIKGDIDIDETVEYVRTGGIISYENYLKTYNPEGREKIERLSAGSITPEYVNLHFEDDIDIEPGKKYLAYFGPVSLTETSNTSYAITYFEGGLREVSNIYNHYGINVYNNFTEEWDSINNLLP